MPRLLLPGAGELLRRLLLVVRRTLAGLLLRGLLLAALLEVHLRFSALNEFMIGSAASKRTLGCCCRTSSCACAC
jgi:hypothetical protein